MEGNEATYEDLLSQNTGLKEELTKCSQDKEFVWNLWKELQSENPDVSKLVNKVMEREQEKADAKDLKVLNILELKDKNINSLQHMATELKGQVSSLNTKLSDSEAQMTDAQSKVKVAEDERNRLKNELHYKEELLKTKEKQLMLAESARKELETRADEKNVFVETTKKEAEGKMKELMQENLLYQQNIGALNEKLEMACIQSENLKESFAAKEEELKSVTEKLDVETEAKRLVEQENEEQRTKLKKLKEALAKKNKECAEEAAVAESEEIKKLTKTNRGLTEQVTERDELVQHLREEITNYQQQLTEQVELIKSLEKLQDETQHVLSQQELTHQQETTALQNSLYELKTNTTQLNKELAVVTAEHKGLKKRNAKLEQACDSLKKAENTLQQELVTVSLETEAFRKRINDLEEELATYRRRNSSSSRTTDETTQTEESMVDSDLELSSVKARRKKEKLHTETQRLLMMKSKMSEDNRALKKRILILENQCTQLQDEKTLLESNAKQLTADNENLRTETEISVSKLESMNVLLQARTKELDSSQEKLRAMSENHLKDDTSVKNLSSRLRSTEDELQVATANCSKLSFQLKTICGENEILMEKQKGFQGRITKQEKIVNQKKTLIDELRSKLNEANDDATKNKSTIVGLNAKLKSLTDRETKDKSYIEKLKSKLEEMTKERSQAQGLVTSLRAEINNKNQCLQETQDICQQAETAISAMERTASQELEKERAASKAKEDKLKSAYNKSTKRVGEFVLVVKNICDALLRQIQEKHKQAQKVKKARQEEKENSLFKKKACDVAASILNMSSADLEEFMAATKDSSTEDVAMQRYKSKDIKEKLDLILGKGDNFEGILTHFMLDLVEYYSSLCISEVQDSSSEDIEKRTS